MKEGTDRIPHGIGIKVDKDGGIFEGYWKDGKLDGWGRYIYNGDYYIGEYKEGKRYGFGIEYYSRGDRYEGEWENGIYHGQGTYYSERLIQKNVQRYAKKHEYILSILMCCLYTISYLIFDSLLRIPFVVDLHGRSITKFVIWI